MSTDNKDSAGGAAAEGVTEPDFTPTARQALAWVLWHHQGASSTVGQPIRFALGMGQHERMPDWMVADAEKWAAASPIGGSARAAPAAAAQVSDEEIDAIWRRTGYFCSDMDKGLHLFARAILSRASSHQAARDAEPVMLNGLTQAETDATASVMGLVSTAQFRPSVQQVARWALEAIEAGANAPVLMNLEGVKEHLRYLAAPSGDVPSAAPLSSPLVEGRSELPRGVGK